MPRGSLVKPLAEYGRKRDFKKTPEPKVAVKRGRKGHPLIFVVQEHHASHLHYDFRLEWHGVLKSWAVPKGPSLDPKQKRLAVEVEDHPLSYATFTGTIPEKQYGAGEVYRWDMGTWEPVNDPNEGLRKGRLEFRLKGKKLKGGFLLVRTRAQGSKPSWLLIKRHDEYVRKGQVETVAVHTSRKKASRKTKANSTARKTAVQPVDFFSPQLARLVDRPPHGKDWVHEIKFDGYRTQAHVNGRQVNLFTRSGKDWTAKYPLVAKALQKLKHSAVLDGEVVWLDTEGRSNFQLLQNALKDHKSSHLIYYVFDLLSLDGKDLTSLPLMARKERLEKLVEGLGPHIRYSEHFRGIGDKMMQASCRHDLEGVVSKRADAPYVSGRHEAWVKSKCIKRQEFVIGGFTEGEGSRLGFGSLLVGFYQNGKFRYAGRCGTGFDQRTLLDIGRRLRRLETKKSPFQVHSPKGRDLHWVQPKLVAEIAFAEWTKDGVMRVPVFYGLRADKPAKEIGIEKPKSTKQIRVKKQGSSLIPVTHPEKLIYAKEKITKGEVAEYYQAVSDWILPHIQDRPLSMLRCPQGATKTCFFSKHFADRLPPEILPIPEEGSDPFIAIDSEVGLRTLIQRGTLEIHPWNCHRDNMDSPDQVVMDFDPDPKVDFERVKEAAWELKEMLDQLKLKSFLKVTGGKGLHVQFPILPIYDWERVKNFAHTLANEMVSRHPELYLAKAVKKARAGKIFIDYLRNGRGATAVAPYSLRAREISAVALPIGWDELEALPRANVFTLEKTLALLKRRKQDPWKDYFKTKQKISIL